MNVSLAKRLAALFVVLPFSLLIFGCGGGTPSSAQPTTVPPSSTPPAAPTASLSVNPGTVVEGGSATLTWQTANATDVSIDDGLGAVQPIGSESVTPTGTTTYTLTAKGAGGTQTAMATVTVTTPPPSTPPPIPTSWTVTDLPPLPGYNGAQANAVNASGHAAGYSSNVMGDVEATEWIDGVAIDLGPGVAVAINDSDQIVGSSVDSTQLVVTAHLWQNGGQSDIGNWQPTGINNSGLVVGDGVSDAATSIQWSQGGTLEPVPGCQHALAVNSSGQIAGVSDTGGNATICGQPDFGVLGSATAINDAGVAVGYAEISALEVHAMQWPSTTISKSAFAVGINEFGWVIGETVKDLGQVRRHFARGTGARAEVQCGVGVCLQSTSHPFLWSEQSGLLSLPDSLGEADGIRGKRIVGAGLVADGTIHGILLDGD